MAGYLRHQESLTISIFDFWGGDIIADVENNKTFTASNNTTLGGNFINNKDLNIGSSPDTFNINGNYIQNPSGVLFIELAGYTQGDEYDFLNITGSAHLEDGTWLDVALLYGFSPVLGSTFHILHADKGISGIFTNINLPTLGGGLGWNVTYGGNDVTLTVTPEPVSSILFLSGGATLAIRAYLRRRMNSPSL